ncbi:hypothetical protein L6452_28986 [Arctium lappa]|uniref:Uncharacterized protein n=1 Tax=Arctium lappa TaxID=4217 RepID=A0ACB8ZG64_ARCLA|nr:hypothetical protein L6452_28986 [Arctium lappa]
MELNTQKIERPPVEELIKRIQDLKDGHDRLKQKMLNFIISVNCQTSNSVPRQSTLSSFQHCRPLMPGTRSNDDSYVKLVEARYFNILQSIDEPIHIANANTRIIYRLVNHSG